MNWSKRHHTRYAARVLVAVVLAAAAAGCARPAKDTLFQVSTIDALLAGVYDGELTCRELVREGDMGLGTFDKLDGEMLVLDGRVYQIKLDGRAAPAPPQLTTPFAAVCRFEPEQTLAAPAGADWQALTAAI